jgi:transcriptional regulator with XRE-family HTH domain
MNGTPDLIELSRIRKLAGSGLAREIRIQAGLSQSEVAEALGVDRSTVHRWEGKERVPRGAVAFRYGQLLEGLLAG